MHWRNLSFQIQFICVILYVLTVEDKLQSTSLKRYYWLYQTCISKPPSYYSFGKLKLNIIHTKFRHCCFMNHDLHNLNVVVSETCSCGAGEDRCHGFFSIVKNKCKKHQLLFQLLQQDHLRVINTYLLLWGDESLSNDINNYLFYIIHTFILKSGRFI